MAELVFFVIAAAICFFAVLVVTSHDIFHSSVWLAMTLLSVAGLYFYLDAPFLGVIQVLVYVGGIITLFVFAIKLTAHIGDKSIVQTNRQTIFAGLCCLILFALLMNMLQHSCHGPFPHSEPISLKQLGQSLVSVYVLPFEFISLLLLAAMVGAIAIGRDKK